MKGLKRLEELNHQTKMDLYKNVPGHAIPRSKFEDRTANGLTKAVLTYLTLKGHYCTRLQSQGQYNPSLKRWTKSTVRKGLADIMAIVNGKTVMIEIKVGKDRLSIHQKETLASVNASGGAYYVCRSFEDFLNFYQNL